MSDDRVRAVVAEMLADAESRSSLLQSGQAGHEGGFFLASADGNFRLGVSGFLQYRYHLNFRGSNSIGDDFESGFTNARTLLMFKGHVYDPRLTYQIRMNFQSDGGSSVLDDAFVDYKFNENWSVRAGQALHPFSREWYHGDLKLQTIERSPVALVFGEQRSQQLTGQYRNESVRVIGSFSDGFRSQNTDLGSEPAEWALTGRTEVKLAGGWGDVIGAYTSPRGSDFSAMIGGAVHFEQGPRDTGGSPKQELLAWTVDATIKGDGWNVFLSGTGYHTEDEAGVSGADFDEYGLVAQGGAYVVDDIELYTRYSALFPDSDRDADDVFSAIAFGMNYYLHGHAARFTVQAEWFPSATEDTVIGNFGNSGGRNPTSNLFGILPTDDDDQVTVSFQFQLAF